MSCGSADEAASIATALVERRFAACVQQLPIRSTYRWDGQVQRDDEVLLLVKTRRDRYPDVERTVLELHSYDLPVVTCLDVVAGSPAALRWIVDETR